MAQVSHCSNCQGARYIVEQRQSSTTNYKGHVNNIPQLEFQTIYYNVSLPCPLCNKEEALKLQNEIEKQKKAENEQNEAAGVVYLVLLLLGVGVILVMYLVMYFDS